jgi:hypothetical protein
MAARIPAFALRPCMVIGPVFGFALPYCLTLSSRASQLSDTVDCEHETFRATSILRNAPVERRTRPTKRHKPSRDLSDDISHTIYDGFKCTRNCLTHSTLLPTHLQFSLSLFLPSSLCLNSKTQSNRISTLYQDSCCVVNRKYALLSSLS